VARIYRKAWEAGCKGITVYREGSRDSILMTMQEARTRVRAAEVGLAAVVNRLAGKVLPAQAKVSSVPTEAELAQLAQAVDLLLTSGPLQLALTPDTEPLRPRPTLLHGVTLAQPAPEGNLQLTINEVEHDPFETLCHGGKAGSDINAWAQALARICSIVLRLQRLPSPLERLQLIADQLEGIAGSRSLGFGPQRVRSGPDAIAQAVRRYITHKTQNGNGDSPTLPVPPSTVAGIGGEATALPAAREKNGNGNICPVCGGFNLILDEGCVKCPDCGQFREC
jgi:ribonucleoside-diphosphate reductase alpha chain